MAPSAEEKISVKRNSQILVVWRTEDRPQIMGRGARSSGYRPPPRGED